MQLRGAGQTGGRKGVQSDSCCGGRCRVTVVIMEGGEELQ